MSNGDIEWFKGAFRKGGKPRQWGDRQPGLDERKRNKRDRQRGRDEKEDSSPQAAELRIRRDEMLTALPGLVADANEALDGLRRDRAARLFDDLDELTAAANDAADLDFDGAQDLTVGLEQLAKAGREAAQEAERDIEGVRDRLQRAFDHELHRGWAKEVCAPKGADAEYARLEKLVGKLGPATSPTDIQAVGERVEELLAALDGASAALDSTAGLADAISWAKEFKPVWPLMTRLEKAVQEWPLADDAVRDAAGALADQRGQVGAVDKLVGELATYHTGTVLPALERWNGQIARTLVGGADHGSLAESAARRVAGGRDELWSASARQDLRCDMELLVRRVETVGRVCTEHKSLVFDLMLARNATSNAKQFPPKVAEQVLRQIESVAERAYGALLGAIEPDEAAFLAELKKLLDLPGPWRERQQEAARLGKAQQAVATIAGLLTGRAIAPADQLAAVLYNLDNAAHAALDGHGVAGAEYAALVAYANAQGNTAVADHARLLLAAVQNTNLGQLQAIRGSLANMNHTAANLTTHHNGGHIRLVYKAPWPWKNNAGNTEVQAGAYLEFTHPWFPGSARWGEVHLHFNARTVGAAALRYAHLKDATLAVVGGNPTVPVPLNNVVVQAIVAHENGKSV